MSKTITKIHYKFDENPSNHPKLMTFILKIEATLGNGNLENRDSASTKALFLGHLGKSGRGMRTRNTMVIPDSTYVFQNDLLLTFALIIKFLAELSSENKFK